MFEPAELEWHDYPGGLPPADVEMLVDYLEMHGGAA